MTDSDSAPRFGRALVRLAAVWLLVGALFKLFVGSPADLPAVVRDLAGDAGLSLGLTYSLAISIELCIGTLALLRPRLGWLLLTAQYAVFIVILAWLLAQGESNCGCFGSKVPVPPWAMLTVDGLLLAAMLSRRPWALPRGGLSPIAIGGIWILCIGATWSLDREAEAPSSTALAPDGVDGEGGGSTGGLGPAPESGWLELDIESWIGKELSTTPLAHWVEPMEFFPDATWVLWRQTCDHCAAHLSYLADTEVGERMLVLLQLEESHDNEANRVVFRLPEGGYVLRASLPSSVEYVVTTPAEFHTEEWKIVSAEEGVEIPGH